MASVSVEGVKPSSNKAPTATTKVVTTAGNVPDESPARTQRDMERVQLEDLNGRLQQYIMKQRAKDASREVWQRDLRAVQDRAGAAISANTKKYDDYLRLMRQQRDEHASAREELQVRVSRQESTIDRLKEQLEQEKQFQEDLGERVTRLSKELEGRSAEVVQLQEKVRLSARSLKAAESARAQLQTQLKEMQGSSDDAEHQVSALRAKCKSLEQDLAISTQTASEEHARLEDVIEELTRQNTDIEDNVREEFAQQLAEIVEDYRKQCSDDKTRITRELKSHYMPKLVEARTALEDMSLREQELRDTNTVLAEEKAALRNEVQLLKETQASLQKRVKDLQNSLEEERNSRGDKEAMQAKDEEIRRLRKELKTLEVDFDQLMDVKIQLVLEIEKYRQLLEEEESRLGLATPGKKRKRARVQKPSRQLLLELDVEHGCLQVNNPSDEAVDLDGWTLQSHALGQAFEFREGDAVLANGSVRVWVGEQTEGGLGEGELVWADVDPAKVAQDNLTLVNEHSTVVDKIDPSVAQKQTGDGSCLLM